MVYYPFSPEAGLIRFRGYLGKQPQALPSHL
jgi:hypothetical protein